MITRQPKLFHNQPRKTNDSKKSSQKTDNNLSAHKLTLRAISAYPCLVGANHQQTAKFRDYYSHLWRQPRLDDAAGFFMPVDFAFSGFMPGSRGLQDGVNRNKRVVFQRDDSRTRQLLPTTKTFFGAVIMTAITMGNTARKLSARLPHLPFAPAHPKHKAANPAIVFNKSRPGLIAYRKGTPLAWLVLGYHQGQVNHQRKLVKFVDVAYHRQTERGISMETAFFDTLTEAKAFVLTTFSNGGVQ